jgi:colanic acid/amylovoran biosynthesis glycosyltransferase
LAENVANGVTGFVVPRRDPAAMAEKLALLAEDSALRLRMGKAGRVRVETHFQLHQQIESFEAFYESL